jgi:hypothetical protein
MIRDTMYASSSSYHPSYQSYCVQSVETHSNVPHILQPLLQPGVQHSIARTRRRRLIGVQTGRDHRLGKLGRERERVTHGQGGAFFIFRESWSLGSGLIQGLTGLWSAVMTSLTSKCRRNSLHDLYRGGYKEFVYGISENH